MTDFKENIWYGFKNREGYENFLESLEINTGIRWATGDLPTRHKDYYSDGYCVHIENGVLMGNGGAISGDKADEIWIPSMPKFWSEYENRLAKREDKNKGVSFVVETRFKSKEYEIIVNEPAVILFEKDIWTGVERKFIAKAHEEEFDVEKGLLMCLAKANGISHLDLKRMLKSVKVQTKKDKKEKKQEDGNIEKLQKAYEEHLSKKSDKVVAYKKAKSPQGRKRGKPFTFEIGDYVVVRDCFAYTYENREDIEPMLNKELEIDDILENTNGQNMYLIDTNKGRFAFAGSEIEPIWEE